MLEKYEEVTPPSKCFICCSIMWQLAMLALICFMVGAVFVRDYTVINSEEYSINNENVKQKIDQFMKNLKALSAWKLRGINMELLEENLSGETFAAMNLLSLQSSSKLRRLSVLQE